MTTSSSSLLLLRHALRRHAVAGATGSTRATAATSRRLLSSTTSASASATCRRTFATRTTPNLGPTIIDKPPPPPKVEPTEEEPKHLPKSIVTPNNATATATTTATTTNNDKTLYWNREEYSGTKKEGKYDYLIKVSPESIVQEAKILNLSDPDDDANQSLLNPQNLPFGSKVLCTGTKLSDFDAFRPGSDNNNVEQPNVVFVSPSCPKARKQLPLILAAFPSIRWVHVRSAGIDFVVSNQLTDQLAEMEMQQQNDTNNNNDNHRIIITNAKGQFSSSLAEYCLMACSYFAKDLPRLLSNQKSKSWIKYDVQELRGKTLGIVGYGDIGRACAKLASVYGMRIVALRRNPKLSINDPFCSVVYGTDKASLNQLMSESDYIVCSAPSTVETRGMVNADAFKVVKKDAVFINLGRGPVVDEDALIHALKKKKNNDDDNDDGGGRLKGAALDVFNIEPLPVENELWSMDNVLLSPHNMDQTNTFMHEACEFFVYENLPRFILGKDLLNPVDPKRGY